MPAIEWRGRPEDRLLTGILPGRIEWSRGLAIQDISAGCIDIGEVSSKRPTEVVVAPLRGGDQEARADHRGGEQGQRDLTHSLGGQPGAGAQNVNETGHKVGSSKADLKEG